MTFGQAVEVGFGNVGVFAEVFQIGYGTSKVGLVDERLAGGLAGGAEVG